MSKLNFAEEHAEILEPIERLVCGFYAKKLINHDYDTIRVYDALTAYYKAIVTNFPLPTLKLTSDSEKTLYNNIVEMSEKYDAKEMLECIKLLKKSALLWNKELGSQGYLNYINQFISPVVFKMKSPSALQVEH